MTHPIVAIVTRKNLKAAWSKMVSESIRIWREENRDMLGCERFNFVCKELGLETSDILALKKKNL